MPKFDFDNPLKLFTLQMTEFKFIPELHKVLCGNNIKGNLTISQLLNIATGYVNTRFKTSNAYLKSKFIEHDVLMPHAMLAYIACHHAIHIRLTSIDLFTKYKQY